MLYVSRFGVYRGRARDEDVGSFSDRPRIPEPKFVGVRGGVVQRPCMGAVSGREGLRNECIARTFNAVTRSKNLSVECSFPSSLNAEETFESALRTFPSPESDSWLVSRPFIKEEGAIGVVPCIANDSEEKKGKECSSGTNAIRTTRTPLHPYADERGGVYTATTIATKPMLEYMRVGNEREMIRSGSIRIFCATSAHTSHQKEVTEKRR